MSGMRLRFFHCPVLASRMALAMASACALFTDVSQAEPVHSSELVKVEGRRVEAVVEGTGTPAVVFESGSNGSSPWELIESQIAQKTMTLRYQRAGLGRSDPGPNPRSAAQVAKELHALLCAKSVRPPYVLVGHSAGGLYVRVFPCGGLTRISRVTRSSHAAARPAGPRLYSDPSSSQRGNPRLAVPARGYRHGSARLRSSHR